MPVNPVCLFLPRRHPSCASACGLWTPVCAIFKARSLVPALRWIRHCSRQFHFFEHPGERSPNQVRTAKVSPGQRRVKRVENLAAQSVTAISWGRTSVTIKVLLLSYQVAAHRAGEAPSLAKRAVLHVAHSKATMRGASAEKSMAEVHANWSQRGHRSERFSSLSAGSLAFGLIRHGVSPWAWRISSAS